jgi:hypothetical protein
MKLVGGAGNAPVVTSDIYFMTLDLQASSRNASQGKSEGRDSNLNGSGSGNHTHLKEFMRLLSVL